MVDVHIKKGCWFIFNLHFLKVYGRSVRHESHETV